MNHQGVLWNVHCVATVVLRKQLNFKSTVIRSNGSSCLLWSDGRGTSEKYYCWWLGFPQTEGKSPSEQSEKCLSFQGVTYKTI